MRTTRKSANHFDGMLEENVASLLAQANVEKLDTGDGPRGLSRIAPSTSPSYYLLSRIDK